MFSRVVSFRIAPALAATLDDFCRAHGQGAGTVARLALRDLLTHPERFDDLVAEQRGFEPLSHAELCAALGLPGDQQELHGAT